MRPSENNPTTLRLVTGHAHDSPLTSRHLGWDAPPPTARPADRCEPWPLDQHATVASLARAAANLGVAFSLAAALTVERSLLTDDLAELDCADIAARLDVTAAQATVSIELSEPLSAYLRALSGHDAAPAQPLPRSVPLPMRLTERIGPRGPGHLLDGSLLTSALAWERAALLSGRTMSEWAALKAFGLRD